MQELRQRSEIGVAVVAASSEQLERTLQSIESFAWSVPTIEVVQTNYTYMEIDH